MHRLQNTIQQLQQNRNNDNNSNHDDNDNKEGIDVLDDTQRQVEELKLILDEQKLRLNKDVAAEKARCIEYENKCLLLERRIKKLEQERKPTTSLVDVLQVKKKNDSRVQWYKLCNYYVYLLDEKCDLIKKKIQSNCLLHRYVLYK